MATKTPVKVSAIVYSAKGLKSRKKDKHKFCVIISVGSQKDKFRTDVVEDLFGNPTFNTECEICVDDVSQPLIFLVTEKHEKDVLGQVSVALWDLVTFRTNRPVRVNLQPHKKCPHPEGELVYEAWISAGSEVISANVRSSGLPVTIEESTDEHKSSFPSGLKKLRDKLSHSPMLSRKNSGSREHKRTNSDSLFPLKPKVSVSCHDLTSLSSYGTASSADAPRLSLAKAADTDSLYSVDSNPDQIPAKPEVTGISPREGPAEGGTKLAVRGSNLGCTKEDVIGLYVCGSNVLSTLEYFSSTKLVCTTKPHRPCSGTIAVETQSGGRGVSLVQFTFIATVTEAAASDTASEASSSLSRSSSRGDADLKRDGSFKGPSDRESNMLSKAGVKARSMFDLSLPAMSVKQSSRADGLTSNSPAAPVIIPSSLTAATPTACITPVTTAAPVVSNTPVTALPTAQLIAVRCRPEVTGISPCDGPADKSTKITLRGTNLGLSRADVLSVVVAGVDCTSTVEFESASRLSCVAGPTDVATSGNIIVTTRSAGVGASSVQFRFTEPATVGHSLLDGDGEWAAVPYDAIPTTISSATTATPGDTLSTSCVTNSRQSTSSISKQPPPVVEIQPMSRSDRRTHSSPRHKAPAPAPPTQTTQGQRSTGSNEHESQLINTENCNRNSTVDTELNEKISELTSHLMSSEGEVKRLQQENKLLREENERMRQYMESLVSKAINSCPQILCVDTSKLL